MMLKLSAISDDVHRPISVYTTPPLDISIIDEEDEIKEEEEEEENEDEDDLMDKRSYQLSQLLFTPPTSLDNKSKFILPFECPRTPPPPPPPPPAPVSNQYSHSSPKTMNSKNSQFASDTSSLLKPQLSLKSMKTTTTTTSASSSSSNSFKYQPPPPLLTNPQLKSPSKSHNKRNSTNPTVGVKENLLLSPSKLLKRLSMRLSSSNLNKRNSVIPNDIKVIISEPQPQPQPQPQQLLLPRLPLQEYEEKSATTIQSQLIPYLETVALPNGKSILIPSSQSQDEYPSPTLSLTPPYLTSPSNSNSSSCYSLQQQPSKSSTSMIASNLPPLENQKLNKSLSNSTNDGKKPTPNEVVEITPKKQSRRRRRNKSHSISAFISPRKLASEYHNRVKSSWRNSLIPSTHSQLSQPIPYLQYPKSTDDEELIGYKYNDEGEGSEEVNQSPPQQQQQQEIEEIEEEEVEEDIHDAQNIGDTSLISGIINDIVTTDHTHDITSFSGYSLDKPNTNTTAVTINNDNDIDNETNINNTNDNSILVLPASPQKSTFSTTTTTTNSTITIDDIDDVSFSSPSSSMTPMSKQQVMGGYNDTLDTINTSSIITTGFDEDEDKDDVSVNVSGISYKGSISNQRKQIYKYHNHSHSHGHSHGRHHRMDSQGYEKRKMNHQSTMSTSTTIS